MVIHRGDETAFGEDQGTISSFSIRCQYQDLSAITISRKPCSTDRFMRHWTANTPVQRSGCRRRRRMAISSRNTRNACRKRKIWRFEESALFQCRTMIMHPGRLPARQMEPREGQSNHAPIDWPSSRKCFFPYARHSTACGNTAAAETVCVMPTWRCDRAHRAPAPRCRLCQTPA